MCSTVPFLLRSTCTHGVSPMNRRSGLALRLCPAPCLCKAKCLPSFFGRFFCHRQRSLEALRVMRTRFGVGNAEASDHKADVLLRSHRRFTDEISKTSFPVSSALPQPPLALPILGQGLGKSPENPPHRGNPRGNSHSQTAKARDNSRPAPTPNSPIPQNLRRNLKRKTRPKIGSQPPSYPVGETEDHRLCAFSRLEVSLYILLRCAAEAAVK